MPDSRVRLAIVVLLVVPGATAWLTAQTRTFQHPLGYRFEHPAAWEVRETAEAIIMLPPDAVRDGAGQPLEVLALDARPAPDVRDLDDPQLARLVDDAAPRLKRVGVAGTIRTPLGLARRLTFEGAINRVDARRDVYVLLHDGNAIMLLHEARRDLAPRRAVEAQRIFASLDYTKPAADPQLLGTWRRSVSSGSSDALGGVFATDSEVIAFSDDGRVAFGVSTAVAGGSAGVSVLGRGNPDLQQGRYGTAAGRLTVTWASGGTEVLDYAVFLHDGVPHLRISAAGQRSRYYRRAP